MPNLADIGYNAEDHNEAIECIREQKLPNITQIIETLVELYAALYNVDAYHINCGLCEDFAHDVIDLLGGAVYKGPKKKRLFAAWGDELIDQEKEDSDKYAYHCIVCYHGRYYDSEHPQGVDDFRDISAFGDAPENDASEAA